MTTDEIATPATGFAVLLDGNQVKRPHTALVRLDGEETGGGMKRSKDPGRVRLSTMDRPLDRFVGHGKLDPERLFAANAPAQMGG